MPEFYVRMTTLAKLLNIGTRTCHGWCAAKLIERHVINVGTHYTGSSVMAFLESHWVGIDGEKPPPLDDVIRGRIRLINTAEAFAQASDALSINSERSFRNYIQNGGFGGYFRLPGTCGIRLLEESVNEVVGWARNFLPRKVAERVLGSTPKLLVSLAQASQIKPVILRSRLVHYRVEDIIRLLCEHEFLPHWITPQQWISDVLSTGAPPMNTDSAMGALGIPREVLFEEMRQRRLRYITLPGGFVRISARSVHEVFLAQPQLPPQTIAHIWGADPRQVTGWLEKGQLTCKLHDHSELEYRRACLVHMLTPALSADQSAQRWFAARLRANHPLVCESQLRSTHSLTHAQVHHLVASGIIEGLRRPDGLWVFQVEKVRRLSRATVKAACAALYEA